MTLILRIIMSLEKVVLFSKKGVKAMGVEIDPVYLLSNTYSRIAAQSTLPDETVLIEAALKEAGCNVKRVDVLWPRNSFSSIGQIYYTIDYFEKYPSANQLSALSWFGDGGCVIPGHDFIIVSSYYVIRRNREKVKKVLQKLFPGEIFFVEPFQGLSFVEPGHIDHVNDIYHIDQTVGCVPSARLITVEKAHYDAAQEDFDVIDSHTDYHVVPIDSGNEICVLGHNYLVVEEQPNVVISNEAASQVNAELRNHGVTVIETPQPLVSMPRSGCSVRCATNRLVNASVLDYIDV